MLCRRNSKTLQAKSLVEAQRPGSAAMRIRRRRADLAGWAFVSPAIVLFVLFVAGPLVFAFGLAMFDWDLLTPPKFVGVENFVDLLTEPDLPRILGNTFFFAFMSIVTHIIGGFALALAANRILSRTVNYFLRTALFFPFLISWAAVSLLWRIVLDPSYGYIPYYAGQIGIDLPNFFNSTIWAMPAIIWIDLWHTIGFTFIILLAGLQTVPRELTEAARTDGASAWQVFWNVTIPLMSPTLFFATIITFLGAFQIFDPIQIITKGGPDGATETIVMYLYKSGFTSFNMGYASAIAILVFVIMMAVTLLQFWGRKKWVHEE